jgi:hypothetical protein
MRKFLKLFLLVTAAPACGPDVVLAQGVPSMAAVASFSVIRNGERIGGSTVHLQRHGEETMVETNTEIRVTIAYITVYHFAKRQTERWVAGGLAALSAVTDDNGKVTRLTALRSGDLLSVNVDGRLAQIEVLPPANLWDPSVLRLTRALDTTDGTITPVSVTDRGKEQIVVRGHSVTTHPIRRCGRADAVSVLSVWVLLGSVPSGPGSLLILAQVGGASRARGRLSNHRGRAVRLSLNAAVRRTRHPARRTIGAPSPPRRKAATNVVVFQ